MIILAPEYRIIQDTIYLVGAIVSVFLFSAPLLKDLLLYSWLTFSPVHTFANVIRFPKAPKILAPSPQISRKVNEPEISERPMEVKAEYFDSASKPNSIS